MADTTAPRGALIPKNVFLPPITNPYGLVDVGFLAKPSFVDIDGDGDLDALIGERYGNTLVYLNTGTASNPAFAAALTNPYGLGNVGKVANPSFVDIDGDGDLDAFIGNLDGNTLVYLNTGTASNPAFAVAVTNPYGLGDVGDRASPTFVDIDSDGDLDAFIGSHVGNIQFYLNTGTASSPAFVATKNYGIGSAGGDVNPSFMDIDGDGDLDALIGNTAGNMVVYRNIGTASSPAFAVVTTNPYGLGDVGYNASPSVVDIDDDGDLDAFIGDYYGNTGVYLNTGTASSPAFAAAVTNPYGLGNVGYSAKSSFVDIDGDGDLDALIVNGATDRLVYLNTGTASSPAFAAALVNPYGLGAVKDPYGILGLADIDGDGDLDAFMGNRDGNTLVYLNTGTASSPAFAAATTNPYGLGDVGSYAKPSFADIDSDGDLDALIGNRDGRMVVFLNTGTASSPAFHFASNNYGLSSMRYGSIPSFVDIDGDGDLDAFMGNSDGNTLVYLNTGTASSPDFAPVTTNSFGLGNAGAYSSPSLADIDGDGDLDVLIGNNQGNTLVFIYADDAVAPVASTNANGTYGIGRVITLTVAFNENVIVNTTNGTPTLMLETGSVDRNAVYTSGSGTSTLTFSYTVKSGDTSADLDYTSTSALALNGGTIRDAAGNNAILTLARPGTTGSLAANAALVIDYTALMLTGGNGSDSPKGGASADSLDGAGGDDSLYGLDGNDQLSGGTGRDVLSGGKGADTMTGGDGSDFYYVENAGDIVIETQSNPGLGGIDTVYSYLTNYTLLDNVERGVVKLTLPNIWIANLTGNALANSLYGSDQANTLSGLAGDDYLNGGAGQDKLVGGLGADTMVGGDGSDLYYVDDAGDKVIETEAQAAGGSDDVYSTLAAYTLTSNVERGFIDTSGVANLTGNALDNYLYGGTGNNKLAGAAGNDYLAGDAGDDVLLGGAGKDRLAGGTGADRMTGGLDADTFVFGSRGGRDVITDFSSSQGDKIRLSSDLNNSGITSGAIALAHVYDSGANAVLELGGGNIVILLGVQTAELSVSDFLVL